MDHSGKCFWPHRLGQSYWVSPGPSFNSVRCPAGGHLESPSCAPGCAADSTWTLGRPLARTPTLPPPVDRGGQRQHLLLPKAEVRRVSGQVWFSETPAPVRVWAWAPLACTRQGLGSECEIVVVCTAGVRRGQEGRQRSSHPEGPLRTFGPSSLLR